MATIYYEITEGSPPFTATLKEGGVEIQQKTGLGLGPQYFVNVPDGDYVIEITSENGCSVELLDHIIVACTTTTTTTAECDVYAEIIIPEITCPPTTTTTSSSTSTSTTTSTTTLPPTTTTTTTDSYIKLCNQSFSLEGKLAYPLHYGVPTAIVVLGEGVGVIECIFSPISIPDRLMVRYGGKWADDEGAWVVDTGYVSVFVDDISKFNIGGEWRYKVVTALIGKPDPLSGLTYPILGGNLTTYTNAGYNVDPNIIETDGYPRIQFGVGGTWTKLTNLTECYAYVFSPLTDTEWLLTIQCPPDPLATTTTTTTLYPPTTTTSTTVLTGKYTLFAKYDSL